jgi:hypothetical protein
MSVEPLFPTVEQFDQRNKSRRNVVFLLLMVALLIDFGAVAGLSYAAPKLPGAVLAGVGFVLFAVMTLPVIIWQHPMVGFYIIFTGAMLFEAIPINYLKVGVITSMVPFWFNLSSAGEMYGSHALSPIKFSLAEMIMVWTIFSWGIRAIALREFKFEKGAFFNWMAAYLCCVVFGFVNGVGQGGDKTMALWEVRPQFYILFAYLMTVNMIKERSQVWKMLWITVICVGIKAFVGISVYIGLKGDISDQGILGHEESLFFNLLFFIVIVGGLIKLDRRMVIAGTLLMPFVLFSDLENQRRAGIAAFVVAFMPVPLLLMKAIPERRLQVKKFLVSVVVIMAIYLPIAWNSDGVWALPARAIKSQTSPDDRDASSDYYRLVENTDLKFTRDQSPLLGYGYGRPFIQIVPLIKLSTDFLDYLPHNSVLWIWMRLGHVGFFCFLMLLTTICVRGAQIVRDTPDRMLQLAGLLGIMAMLMLFIYGKYDLQLTNYRTVVMTSIFIGILGVLPRLAPPIEPPEELEPGAGKTPNLEPASMF